MAKIFLLGAVLVILLSFHGALGFYGLQMSQPAMEKCFFSHKDLWASRIDERLKLLVGSSFPISLSRCRIGGCIYKSIHVTLVGGAGRVINVRSCFELRLDCLLLKARVTVCAITRMTAVSIPLVIDSCTLDAEAIVIAHLSGSIPIPPGLKVALAILLHPLICDVINSLSVELNLVLNFNLGPYPFFQHCQCTYVPYDPHIDSTAVHFHFHLRLNCGSSIVTLPTTSSQDLTVAGNSDSDGIVLFFTTAYLDYMLNMLLQNGHFNSDIILTIVTTTDLMENFPEITCPEDQPIRIIPLFERMYVEVQSDQLFLCFVASFEVGYQEPGGRFVRLLRVRMVAKYFLFLTIDCIAGRLFGLVDVSTDIQIEITCVNRPCTIPGTALDKFLQLSSHCSDLINAQIKVGLVLVLPTRFPCRECRQAVTTQKYVSWFCTLSCGA